MKRSIFSLMNWLAVLAIMAVAGEARAQLDYLKSIKKFDMHFHTYGDAQYLRDMLAGLNMKVCSISANGRERIEASRDGARTYPQHFAWAPGVDKGY